METRIFANSSTSELHQALSCLPIDTNDDYIQQLREMVLEILAERIAFGGC